MNAHAHPWRALIPALSAGTLDLLQDTDDLAWLKEVTTLAAAEQETGAFPEGARPRARWQRWLADLADRIPDTADADRLRAVLSDVG